jgi:[CysO sulfur-carrier protein]-S-L-cysteine hydrolase
MQQPILLPRKILNQLLHSAQISPEMEICGLLACGSSGVPCRIYPITNRADAPHHRFLLDATEQISAFRQIRENGETLFAIYHSHPQAPATPSAADIEQAAYPDAFQLIISLGIKGVLELRAFQFVNGDAIELDLILSE